MLMKMDKNSFIKKFMITIQINQVFNIQKNKSQKTQMIFGILNEFSFY